MQLKIGEGVEKFQQNINEKHTKKVKRVERDRERVVR